MNRRFGWAAVVAAGMLLGFVSSSHQKTSADPPAAASAEAETQEAQEAQEAEAIEQLKEINAQLKEISTMLRTGSARVTVVINPDAP